MILRLLSLHLLAVDALKLLIQQEDEILEGRVAHNIQPRAPHSLQLRLVLILRLPVLVKLGKATEEGKIRIQAANDEIGLAIHHRTKLLVKGGSSTAACIRGSGNMGSQLRQPFAAGYGQLIALLAEVNVVFETPNSGLTEGEFHCLRVCTDTRYQSKQK